MGLFFKLVFFTVLTVVWLLMVGLLLVLTILLNYVLDFQSDIPTVIFLVSFIPMTLAYLIVYAMIWLRHCSKCKSHNVFWISWKGFFSKSRSEVSCYDCGDNLLKTH